MANLALMIALGLCMVRGAAAKTLSFHGSEEGGMCLLTGKSRSLPFPLVALFATTRLLISGIHIHGHRIIVSFPSLMEGFTLLLSSSLPNAGIKDLDGVD